MSTPILKQASDYLANKFLSSTTIVKIHDFLKNFLDSIRIPPFLSFLITKSGTISPTIDQTMADAPDASSNWDRLGMDKKVFGDFPRWMLFFFCALIIFINNWSDIAINTLMVFQNFMLSTNSFPNGAALPFKYAVDGLIYLIGFFAKFGGLVPLMVIGYYIVKSFKK